ncbi:MAG TPA: InlB B-repeat-containing protein [Bacilli bacterium]|nr:InlB B-repeat-containing protein [Bacilli bacterium]
MKKYVLFFAFIFFASFLLFSCQSDVDQFTITFNSNGGSSVTSITQDKDSTINKPTDPEKDGYTFEGWFIEASLSTEVVWPYTITSNVTFYAKWQTTTTYTITWEVNGVVIETDTQVPEGTIPTYNGPTPSRVPTAEYVYTFTGWNPTVVAATSNQTYQAQFSYNDRQYTITFDSRGGSSVEPITLNYNTLVQEPTEPTREGYHFVAWCNTPMCTDEVQWPFEMTDNITLYAKWNEVVPYGTYLSSLLSSYEQNPYSYIPDTMKAGSLLITQQQSVLDYSTFVNVSSIPYGGFGEQWKMVISNIEQSKVFFDVLNVIDSIASASVTAFNNYLDTNPTNTARFEFTQGIYQVTILFEDGVMNYLIDYTTTLPGFGEQTIQIALSYDINTEDKVGRIQIGDANALRYEVTHDSYKFGIRYLGVRRAYFEIFRDQDGNVDGRIFEYIGIDGSFTTGSAAEFFINDDYVSVVGNKSSSMMGWTGTINELYDVDSGKLLGYEVKETLSSITYNTLWFNLDNTTGITTIKCLPAPLENSNPHLIYLNGSANTFVAKTVGGFSTKMLSRRYDIELRKQYFYYMNGEELVEVALNVPMLFVQEEQLSTLVTDVNTSNAGLTFGFNASTTIQNQIMSDYDTLIDPFNLQKEEFTIQNILDYIGVKYTHE